MHRFAYYISAHHKPDQLRRLIGTLRRGSPGACIVLHLDASKGLIDPAEFSGLPGVHLVPEPTQVKWGLYSQLEMNFNTLSWMLDNLSFDWVANLSAQDYPLQPLEAIERFYRNGTHDGYISGVPLDSGMPCDPMGCPQADPATAGATCADCIHRYHYRYYDISAVDQLARHLPLWRRFHERLIGHMSRPGGRLHSRTWPAPGHPRTILGIRNDHIFHSGFRCHKGFAWFTINRHAVVRLLDFLKRNPRTVRHFRRTLIADEMVIQTILCNDEEVSICGDNQRFIHWENEQAPHPTTLTCAHHDLLAGSGKHFARKFDIDTDSRILDLLDKRVLDGA